MTKSLTPAGAGLWRLLLLLFLTPAVITEGRAQSDIVDVAAGNPNFSILVEAVAKAELVDALRGPGPFTVFAPTNDAFKALFAQLGVGGVADLTKEQLTPILLYHVLGQEVPSSALKAGQTAATLQKGLVTILKRDGKVTVNGISVVIPDVEASNGVIHAIDRVLLPNDIVAVASSNPRFSTLVEAVAKAELVDALRGAGPFTVFAPTNAAFRSLFIQLGIEGVADLTKEQLTPILLYHVLGGAVLSTDLSDGLTAPTLLEGNRITVSINGNRVRIDGNNVGRTDLAATNGVIHVVDKVLIPTGKVTRFTLVNAQTGADIQAIEPGSTINLGSLSASQVSVRADVFPQAVGSVVLQLNDTKRTENFLPYALLGDSYLQTPVTYNPWNPQSGEYTITATPYPRSQGRGTAGVPLSVTFNIVKPNTIVDVAAGNPNFSILVEAVTKAELVDALRSAGPFTVFAPTNDAFKALFAQLGVGGVADLTKEQLTPILLYHVLGQEVPSSALKAGQTAATLQKGLVTILKRDGKVTVNGISVVIPDVEADNGVIHAIDRVLLPNDIVAVAAGNPNFSTLVEAVTKAELVDALRGAGPFTVFAPTNAAFSALFTQLGIGGVADLTKEQLTPILLYHVVGGAVLSTDLSDGLTAPTLLEGNRITVSINGSSVKVDNSNVAATDVAATNGVIHVLESVLLPTGKVTRLTLVNAQTGADIQAIEPGSTINLGTLSASQVSVRADVFPQAVGSVVLQLNDRKQTENFLPYSLLGDSYLKKPVTYNPWSPESGEFTITATPYSGAKATGTAGVPLAVTFSVVSGGDADADDARITVYPNPSDQVANLRFADGGNDEVQISVYDNYGKLFLQERKRLSGGESRVDLSALPRGMYQVNVLRGSKTQHVRINKR